MFKNPEEAVSIMFGNIETIYPLNEKFYSELSSCIQEKENRKQRQLALQMHQVTEQIANSITTGLSDSVNDSIQSVMETPINDLKSNIDQMSKGLNDVENDKQLVSNWCIYTSFPHSNWK